ncbi:MAG: class I SAM-dependent methyltransferase [Chlorobi bacterium]|nr:class I SAM-dependent methyltransferase [Chlorobiota bacterium]MCI0716077.1 class I SAM-dependent methyltransferase [Chlorobiota bacterium]
MNDEKQISFDDYVETYKKEVQDSINFIGQDVDFFIELKADLIIKLAEKNFGNLDGIKVLDIGSGIGLLDFFLKDKIKNLRGVDVSAGAVENAGKKNPGVSYTTYDGGRLPYDDRTFDFCFAVNVMHHVLPEMWKNFSNEMHRVLKKGGITAVFEHNPLNPLTRLAVAKCEFDRDAVLLSHKKIKSLLSQAGFTLGEDAYIIFFPFKSKFFRSAESLLKWLPLGAQQFVSGRKT